MLGERPPLAFTPRSRLDQAYSFNVGAPGPHVTERSPFVLTLDAGRTTLRLTSGTDFRPRPFTIVGWHVGDPRRPLDSLKGRGVATIRREHIDHDRGEIWLKTEADREAGFQDRNGGTLSLTGLAAMS